MAELYRFHHIISGFSDKPKVLFLHGFMGRIDEWDAQNESFRPDYQCMFLDLPGHGATEVRHKAGYEFIKCAEGIAELIRQKHFSPVSIVGYSLGGRIALYIALSWPDEVNHLVLESASPGIATKEDRLKRSQQDALLAEKLKVEWPEFVENWYRQPLFKGIFESSQFSRMIERKKLNNPEKLACVLNKMGQGAQPPLWNDLKNLQKPVLLLTGANDPKYMFITEKMTKKIPHCTRLVIPDCSHNIHLQNPGRFNAEVRNFLSRD